MPAVKLTDLRSKNKDELLGELEEHKKQLATLRVAKVTNSNAGKLAQIKVVRKNIARVLTVYNQMTKKTLRENFGSGKYVPIDLRAKKTRAIRRRLSPEQASKKTVKGAKRDMKIPKRKYGLKA